LTEDREREFLSHVCEPLNALIESGELAAGDAEAVLGRMIDMLRLKVSVFFLPPTTFYPSLSRFSLLTHRSSLHTPSSPPPMDGQQVQALLPSPILTSLDDYDAQLLTALRQPALLEEMERYREAQLQALRRDRKE
jgi:hypothetical protein